MTQRLGIFLPRSTPFYLSLFFQIKHGFEAIGIEVAGGTEHLAGDSLLEFCRQFKPDALFEMNRSRHEIPELPRNIKHIAWIVDNNGRQWNSFKESEIIYYFSRGGIESSDQNAASIVEWLPPGTCPQNYLLPLQKNYISDFSFIGHMCYPWSEEEKKRLLYEDDRSKLCFEDILEPYTEIILQTHNNANQSEATYLNLAQKIIKKRIGHIAVLDPPIQYDIACRFFRMLWRTRFLDIVLACSRSVRFFGTGGWHKWPQYRSFFQGFLADPKDVCMAYQTTRINLHHGAGVHFRVVDCMASGGLLFYLEPEDDQRYGGIQTLFEPNIHYVPVNEDNFSETSAYYLKNQASSQKIIQAASTEILAKHTWKHRAEKIKQDLKKT